MAAGEAASRWDGLLEESVGSDGSPPEDRMVFGTERNARFAASNIVAYVRVSKLWHANQEALAHSHKARTLPIRREASSRVSSIPAR